MFFWTSAKNLPLIINTPRRLFIRGEGGGETFIKRIKGLQQCQISNLNNFKRGNEVIKVKKPSKKIATMHKQPHIQEITPVQKALDLELE